MKQQRKCQQLSEVKLKKKKEDRKVCWKNQKSIAKKKQQFLLCSRFSWQNAIIFTIQTSL